MRREYEMSEEDLAGILDASKPTPVMYLTGGRPMGPSQQENANSAWQRLGERMGFDWKTVRPTPGKGQRFFSAEEVAVLPAPEVVEGEVRDA